MQIIVNLFWVFASLGLAFLVGFAIQRGSVCAVVAAHQLVLHRRWNRTRAYLIAACWSMAVIVPLAWLLPEQVHLSPSYPVGISVVFFAALYGVGAFINGACAFGTLSGFTRGNLNYAATIAGMFVGAMLIALTRLDTGDAERLSLSILREPSVPGLAVLAAALLIIVYASRRHYQASRRWARPIPELIAAPRWRVAPSVAILGVAGGLLYTTAGDWTYMAVLSERAANLTRTSGRAIEAGPLLATLSVVAGGVVAARLSGRFRWHRPNLGETLRKLAGGTIMSFAAGAIPGGNDVLLLYGLPSLAPYAITAYAAMILTLCTTIFLLKSLPRRVGT